MPGPPDKRKTLAEALDTEDLPDLYAPGIDQRQRPPEPPANFYGDPIPKDIAIRQPPHPDQKHLPLTPLDHYPANGPKPTPVSAWDQQQLGPDERFKSFWIEMDAREQLLRLLQAIQKAKQAADIAKQEAEKEAETARQNAEIARLVYWDVLDPEKVFTFDKLFTTPPDWFTRKNKKRFLTWVQKWVQKNEYPEDLAARQIIARVGYERLVAKAQENRLTRNLLAKHKKRDKPTPPANPLPEPVERQPADKSRASNEK